MKKVAWYHLLIPLIGFIGFMVFILPQESIKSDAFGLEQSPDTSIFYTGEQLYQIAESYGAEGRAFYVHQRFTFDVVWPLAYGLFLCFAILYFSQRIESKWVKKIYYLPIGAVLIDYLENIMTATVMYRFPKETIIISDLAGMVTLVKWLSLSLAFVALFVMAMIVLYQKILKGVKKL